MDRRAKILILFALGWGILLHPSFLFAIEITPFYTQNQSPVVRIFGLPSIGDAALVPARKADVRLLVDWANNYVDESNQSEQILLDGESVRTALDARYGISRDFEVGVVVPFIYDSGGILDGFIDWFHDTFGFSGGGRDQAPKNRLLYQYEKNGVVLLHMNDSGSGLGDLRLNAGWQVYGGSNEPSAIALRASLKLPTGDSNRLKGSGSTDLAVWAVGSRDFKVGSGHLALFGAAGGMGMTDGDVLTDQQRNLVAFGALGFGWSPVRWFALKIQANGHTAFYKDSGLDALSGDSVQLTLGGSFAFSQHTTLDIGVTEDIIIRTSPDVVFHFDLRHRF